MPSATLRLMKDYKVSGNLVIEEADIFALREKLEQTIGLSEIEIVSAGMSCVDISFTCKNTWERNRVKINIAEKVGGWKPIKVTTYKLP